MQTESKMDYALLVTLALIWSTSFLLIKIGVEEMGPFTLTAIRLIVSAVALLGLLKLMGGHIIINRHTMWLYIIVGVIGNALPFSLISLGEVDVDSSLAAVLMGVMPVSTCLLAHIFIPSESMTMRKAIGTTLGLGGLIALVGVSALGHLGGQPLGQLYIIAGAFCYAIVAVYVRLYGSVGDIAAAAGAGVASAVASVLMAFVLENPTQMTYTEKGIWVAVILGLVHSALAMVIYFRVIRNITAVSFSQINYMIPLFGSVWGVMFLGEPFGLHLILALILVLAGSYFVQPRQKVNTSVSLD